MKFLSRIENWLLLIPALLLVIEKIFFNPVLDLHLYDTYIVLQGVSFTSILLVALIIPFVCHVVLRSKNKGNKKIQIAHVLISLLIVLALVLTDSFKIFNVDNGMPRRYFAYSGWRGIINEPTFYAGATILTFILIQVLFVLYTIVVMIKSK